MPLCQKCGGMKPGGAECEEDPQTPRKALQWAPDVVDNAGGGRMRSRSRAALAKLREKARSRDYSLVVASIIMFVLVVVFFTWKRSQLLARAADANSYEIQAMPAHPIAPGGDDDPWAVFYGARLPGRAGGCLVDETDPLSYYGRSIVADGGRTFEFEDWGGCARFDCGEGEGGAGECDALLADMAETLGLIMDVMEAPWFVEGAYMLRLMRDPLHVPHDSDVDMVVRRRDVEFLTMPHVRLWLANVFKLYIFVEEEYLDGRVCALAEHPLLLQAEHIRMLKEGEGEGGRRPPVHVDLAMMGWDDRMGMLTIHNFRCAMRACDPDLFPAAVADAGGGMVRARLPHKSDALAKFLYGPDWREGGDVSGTSHCTPGGGFADGT
jgi:hypothetical protein